MSATHVDLLYHKLTECSFKLLNTVHCLTIRSDKELMLMIRGSLEEF